MKVVVNGAGAAGKAITELLIFYSFGDIIVIDTKGALYKGRPDLSENPYKEHLSEVTNYELAKGDLKTII